MRKNQPGSQKVPGFQPQHDWRYLAFYKPFEVLSQFSATEDPDKTTLAAFEFPPDVYPIGRLDYDSEGLLLLSDDGRLNEHLLHPTKRHERTYLVQVENIPDVVAIRQLETGVMVQGQKTLPARVVLLEDEPPLPPRAVPIRFRKNIPTAWLQLSIIEGRNRQVRRMTAAVGHPTLRLVRVSIGKLQLSDLNLEPGQWCDLTGKQVMQSLE